MSSSAKKVPGTGSTARKPSGSKTSDPVDSYLRRVRSFGPDKTLARRIETLQSSAKRRRA